MLLKGIIIIKFFVKLYWQKVSWMFTEPIGKFTDIRGGQFKWVDYLNYFNKFLFWIIMNENFAHVYDGYETLFKLRTFQFLDSHNVLHICS